ncbi:hypothetical protein VE02_09805 [Pseudogymnoascus sp. 03VT05]|nr:hypothetical protein VE02_09805 [Pseudogymnoascus sp. 03VT05]
MAVIFVAAVAAFALLLTYAVAFVGQRERNIPNGPPTLPIIGNLHQMPKKGAHFKFTKWAQKYGGIYSLKLGTGTLVSSVYSNRPPSFVGNGIITGGDHLLVMNYGNLWRSFRKVIHQYFMESMVEKQHIKLQNAEAVQMMRDFVLRPDQHMLHPKRYSNSITMSLVFGIRTPTCETEHMGRLYHLMENWSKVMETGNTPPVDIYPFLHYVPERFLGNWRSRASVVRDEMNSLYRRQVERVIARREASIVKDSFMDTVLNQNAKLDYTEHQLSFLGGVMMEGGSDTSSAIIISCIQAMTRWPEIQHKAQAEIDSVVGEDRSPVWSDYKKLPYIAATVKEAMRWRPVVPLGFPHCAAEDDWIDGKFIPKGTIIIINAWGMHHDATRFPNPDVFDPAHYEGVTALASELASAADYNKRDHYGYGAGRRLCPGIHIAERNLFLGIAKLLWGFDFAPGANEEGKVLQPDTDPVTGYCEGFLVCAKDFKCGIKPRSEARRETILREFGAEKEVFAR